MGVHRSEHGWSTGRKADRDYERRRRPTLSTHSHRDLIPASPMKKGRRSRRQMAHPETLRLRAWTVQPCGCSLTPSLVDGGMALVFWSGWKADTWPHLGDAGEADALPAAVLL